MSQENNDIHSGLVLVSWHLATSIWNWDRQVYDKVVDFDYSCWPIQCIANHLCCPNMIAAKVIKPTVLALMEVRFRTRCVMHDVPTGEMIGFLSEYGIEKDMLPTDMGGTVQLDLPTWAGSRRAIEMEEI